MQVFCAYIGYVLENCVYQQPPASLVLTFSARSTQFQEKESTEEGVKRVPRTMINLLYTAGSWLGGKNKKES